MKINFRRNNPPLDVQTYVKQLFQPSEEDPSDGWDALHDALQLKLKAARERFNAEEKETGMASDEARRQCFEIDRELNELTLQMECVKRLIEDDRMTIDVWEKFRRSKMADAHRVSFIHSAWQAAMISYRDWRESLDKARDACRRISRAAGALAEALADFEKTRVPGPDEFFQVKELVRNTQGDAMWSRTREALFMSGGPEDDTDDYFGEEVPDEDPRPLIPPLVVSVLEPEDIGLDEYQRLVQSIRYAWTVAPSTSDCLLALAEKADQFEIDHPLSFILSAIESQRPSKNQQYEYIRAFAALLKEAHVKIKGLGPAIAATTNVALNLSDEDGVNEGIVSDALRVEKPKPHKLTEVKEYK